MPRYLVLNEFVNSKTNERHKKGSFYETKDTPTALIKAGCLTPVAANKEKPVPPASNPPVVPAGNKDSKAPTPPPAKPLEEHTYAELVDLAKSLNVPTQNVKKVDLIEAIKDAQAEEDENGKGE